MHPNANLSTPFYQRFSSAGAQCDTAQSPVFWIVPSSFTPTNMSPRAHDIVNYYPPVHTASVHSDSTFSAFRFSGSEGGVSSMYPVSQFVPLGSSLPAFSSSASPYYATTVSAPNPSAQLAQPAQHAQASQAPPLQQHQPLQQPISYVPAGTVEQRSSAVPVTYMIMNPNILSPDTSGFFHYSTSAQTAAAPVPLQQITGGTAHVHQPVTLMPVANQNNNYTANKSNGDAVMRFEPLGGIPAFIGTTTPGSSQILNGSGSSGLVGAHPPPYTCRHSHSASGTANMMESTDRPHSGAAPPKESLHTRGGPPASLATTPGVRSFVAPPPVGSRFVPNAPLITSVPPLARRTPEWGVLPRRLVDTGAPA